MQFKYYNNCYKVLEQILRQTKMCDLKAYIEQDERAVANNIMQLDTNKCNIVLTTFN